MPTQEKKSIRRLFEEFAAIMVELRQRDVVRSRNNPVADYAEFLVCKALSLKREPASTKGYDAKDRSGRRYEIKSRRPTPENRSRQLSAIRDLDGAHFEFLVIVLFAPDFSVSQAFVVSAKQVKNAATYREHVNAWILHARDSLFSQSGVRDITAQVRDAANAS